MKMQCKPAASACPVTSVTLQEAAFTLCDDLVQFCRTSELPFGKFEKELLVRVAVLGCCLIRLFLTVRHERLDVQPFLDEGPYRPGDPYAERTLKTVYGEVTYGRQYLQARGVGHGLFPLDIVLGLTWTRRLRGSCSGWPA